jgi:ferredoxin-NADP reductase
MTLLTSRLSGNLRVWDAENDTTLVCSGIRDETHDVRTFFFHAAGEAVVRHLPGQYFTFTFDVDGQEVHRCYTISSSPTRPDTVSITVKRKVGGLVSNWLHDRLRVGDRVQVLGPGGTFTCATAPADRYLFVSGGSGITPLMSMVRAFADLEEDADIVFVHAARTPRDLIFRDELLYLAARWPRLRVSFVCDELESGIAAAPASGGAQATPHCHPGRLTAELLSTLAPDLLQREVFCCGPAEFMSAVRGMLAGLGHETRRYHQESFSFEQLSGSAVSQSADAPADRASAPTPRPVAEGGNAGAERGAAVFTVTFARSGQTVSCRADQFVLEAARAAGLRLPAACTQGMCGTCKSSLVSGRVDMKHQGGIRQREIDRGLILVCCSRPLSDLVIDR